MKYPKLKEVVLLTEPLLWRQASPEYWSLLRYFEAVIVTSEGVVPFALHPGWVSDKRSGSKLVDVFVPKDGNDIYNTLVSAHDCGYSGWLTKGFCDDVFVRQGFQFSGECGSIISNIAYHAVDKLGKSSYYNLEDTMPCPYTHNRNFERMSLEAKYDYK